MSNVRLRDIDVDSTVFLSLGFDLAGSLVMRVNGMGRQRFHRFHIGSRMYPSYKGGFDRRSCVALLIVDYSLVKAFSGLSTVTMGLKRMSALQCGL